MLASACGHAFLLPQFVVVLDLASNVRSSSLIDARRPVFTVQYPHSSNRFLFRNPDKIQDNKYVSMLLNTLPVSHLRFQISLAA